MVKKQDLGVIFKATEKPAPTPVDSDLPSAGPLKSSGVALNQAELDAIEAISKELDVPRNQVMRLAIRNFIKLYRSGGIDLSGRIFRPEVPRGKIRLD